MVAPPLKGKNEATSVLTNVPPPSNLPSFITSSSTGSSTASYVQETKSDTNHQEPSSKNLIVGDTEQGPLKQPIQMTQPISSTNLAATVTVSTGPSVSSETSASKNQGDGWIRWIKGTVHSVGSKVVEKARNSMDTMITTLDPQMKEFINSGGDIDIVVASDKSDKILPVREAFQYIFGKATVSGIASQCSTVASQPVGVSSAVLSAEQRINYLRTEGIVHPQQPIIAIEGFIILLFPDGWFEMSLLLLDDPWHDIILQVFTQSTPIPLAVIKAMEEGTPFDYTFKESGHAVTIGQSASKILGVSHTNWHEELTSVSRRESLHLTAKSLAGLYRKRLPINVI